MPKMKTHKGVAKRVKVTATGKVMLRRAGRRHLLSKKAAKRRRALRKLRQASPSDAARIKRLLGKA
jgi:large subunit ribosomal protein L35